MSESNNITALLQRWQAGEAGAQDELFQLVYRELRRIAQNRLRHEPHPNTLQATELVHEIYPQIARQNAPWQNRNQFYALASECMRRYLVDHARNRTRQKRGGEFFKVTLSDLNVTEICRIKKDDEVLGVDRALTKLSQFDEMSANVIKHRYFGGLQRAEIAAIMEVSPSTIDRAYGFAKAWLKRELTFEFSPYLLSAGQIKDKPGMAGELRFDSGNLPARQWREVFSPPLLDEIDSAEASAERLLPLIVAEINKYMLGSLAAAGSGGDHLGGDRTQLLPDAHIKTARRRLEESFPGMIERLT